MYSILSRTVLFRNSKDLDNPECILLDHNSSTVFVSIVNGKKMTHSVQPQTVELRRNITNEPYTFESKRKQLELCKIFVKSGILLSKAMCSACFLGGG